MHKTPYVFPIVGGRKVSHLKGNIEALGIELSKEDIEEIESAVQFDVGFPLNMMYGMVQKNFNFDISASTSEMALVKAAAYIDDVPKKGAIKPRKL